MDAPVTGGWWALPILGFIVGGLVGATGVGAGSLTTPALVLGFGVHPVVAVGIDLLFATVTKLTGAIAHRKLGSIDARVFGWLGTGSLPAAAITLALLAYLDFDKLALAQLIKIALGVVLLLTVAMILLRPWYSRRFAAHTSTDMGCAGIPTRPLVVIGCILGGLVALTSIGAGSLGVVALAMAMPAMTTRRIIGTDIAHAIPLTLVCGLGHLAMGHMDVCLLGLLLAGSMPGVCLGSQFTHRLPDVALRWALAAALSVAAILLLRG